VTPPIRAVDPTRRQGRLTLALHRFGMSRAGRWYGIEIGSRIDPWLLRLTGGRFATTSFLPLVLLTVPGRRSAEPRTVPLVYFTEGDEVILVASSFGRRANPAWYLNLMAAGEGELTAGGVTVRAHVRRAEGEERRRLFELAERNYAGYGNYEAMATDREIPVVALRAV
jgi:deazaflavin-dependent oxidoreductase (nitroreductase family)